MIFIFIVSVFIVIQGVTRYQKTGSVYQAIYLSKKHLHYLNTYFTFYQKLPPESKKVFSQRVARFITTKKFIARNIDSVSDEMKVLISASAIQLTFGFPKLQLSHFRIILVYPDAYYSTINRTHHKGEVNPRLGAIVLSWKSFVEGYIHSDGRNLGLHEMAHALRLENKITNEEYNFLDPQILKEWEIRAAHTMREIDEGREEFFREYGAVNSEEFFAVAVENFFEQPVRFLEKHPLTYTTLSKLLRQDPALLEKP
ncbi:MAG: zinc-dependent peptidase [Cyclobacteriaceae bacterium]